MGTFCKEKKKYRIVGNAMLMTRNKAQTMESERSGNALVALVKAGREQAYRNAVSFDVIKFTEFLMANADKFRDAFPRPIEEVTVFETIDGRDFPSRDDAMDYAVSAAVSKMRRVLRNMQPALPDAELNSLARMLVEEAEPIHNTLHALLVFPSPEEDPQDDTPEDDD